MINYGIDKYRCKKQVTTSQCELHLVVFLAQIQGCGLHNGFCRANDKELFRKDHLLEMKSWENKQYSTN